MNYTLVKRLILSMILLGGLLACSSGDDEKKVVKVKVSDAHMPALAPGQTTGAVYMKMRNPSKEEKILNHVEADIAGMTHVHRNVYKDGVMKMRMVHHLTLSPKQVLMFEPGGYHIMLMDVAEKLVPGDAFPMVLHFEGGETVEVNVEVRAVH